MLYKVFWISLGFTASLTAAPSGKAHTLYNGLDPSSITEHVAFYTLYSNTPEGEQALRDIWRLLDPKTKNTEAAPQHFPLTADSSILEGLITLISKGQHSDCPLLSPEHRQAIFEVGSHLGNRSLRGYKASSEEDVLNLPSSEIDLARGLLLSHLGNDPDAIDKIESYEAFLDLMALQIKARIPPQASPIEKIEAINALIFEQMRFRFPPQSETPTAVDTYTFLSSVLDSRRGVCLGVSTLYLCLAQRLQLPLEIITPPGHIYIRYTDESETTTRNIETTARGIHLDSDDYLSINLRSLPLCALKEVIGMAHFNQAALHWNTQDYAQAATSYHKALLYMPEDPTVMELLGYALLLSGEDSNGKNLLQKARHILPDYAVAKDPTTEDLLEDKVGPEGIQATFLPVDETQESILKKQEAITQALKIYPNFRSGWLQLAICWLQQHREREALSALDRYSSLDDTDPTVAYYRAILHTKRRDYRKAWQNLRQAEHLTLARQHKPKALEELRRHLAVICPE